VLQEIKHLLIDAPPHVQADFVANLLEEHRKSLLREENPSLFAHLDLSMKKMKNSAFLEVRMRLTSFSSTPTLKCYK